MKKLFVLALIFVHSLTAMGRFNNEADLILGGTKIDVYQENGETHVQIGTTRLSFSNLLQAYKCADRLYGLLDHPGPNGWTRTSTKSAKNKLSFYLPRLRKESEHTIQPELIKSLFQKLQTALKIAFAKKQTGL